MVAVFKLLFLYAYNISMKFCFSSERLFGFFKSSKLIQKSRRTSFLKSFSVSSTTTRGMKLHSTARDAETPPLFSIQLNCAQTTVYKTLKCSGLPVPSLNFSWGQPQSQLFSTSSPANYHSQNSVSKFTIKSTGHLIAKSLIFKRNQTEDASEPETIEMCKHLFVLSIFV